MKPPHLIPLFLVFVLNGSLPHALAESPEESKVLNDSLQYHYNPVPSGLFQMGDAAEKDTPVHPASLDSFHIGTTEVSVLEWNTVFEWAKKNGYDFAHPGTGKVDNQPITDVSWFDVVKWCNAKSEMESLKPCYYTANTKSPKQVYRKGQISLSNNMVDWDAGGYRLPTEAEWEKAARGGLQGKKYPHGDIIGRSHANFSGSSPKQVAHYEPNKFGLYDMAGNVLEWCWDWYGESYYKASPPTAPKGAETGTRRVTRGGSWYANAGGCRVSRRDCSDPDQAVGSLGFRVVRK